MSTSFTELPTDILDTILSNLELKDALSLAQCNKQLRLKVCDCHIWRRISVELWNQYQEDDILTDFNCLGFVPIIKIGHLVDIHWYSYCLNRLAADKQIFAKLEKILTFQQEPIYWKKLWKYFQNSGFVSTLPQLVDIVDSDLIRGSQSYRYDRLNLFGYSHPSLAMKKIASELLSASRHNCLFNLTTLYCAGNDGFGNDEFRSDDSSELLLLKYSTIDAAYHRLLPYRKMFLKLVDRILTSRQKRLNEDLKTMDPLRKIGILAQVVMGIIRKNKTNFLQRHYAEDLMLLRVYAGETKGILLIHLAILQKVLESYRIDSQLLQRHLKIEYKDDSSNSQSKVIFLSVSEDTLQYKLFTENQLRQVVGTHHFEHYMKPLSKQEALKWLSAESSQYKRSNSKDPENPLGIEKWDLIYRHSQLPLFTPVVKAFNGMYSSLSSDNTIIGPPMKVWQIIYGHFDDVMSAFTPIEYKLLDSIHEKTQTAPDDYSVDDYRELHELWLEDQYMIKDLKKQKNTDIVGKISCIDWDTFFCVLGTDLEDPDTMIVIDTFGEISKVNKNIVVQNETGCFMLERSKQLDVFLKIMGLSNRLGLLFDHFDMKNHGFVLLTNTDIRQIKHEKTPNKA